MRRSKHNSHITHIRWMAPFSFFEDKAQQRLAIVAALRARAIRRRFNSLMMFIEPKLIRRCGVAAVIITLFALCIFCFCGQTIYNMVGCGKSPLRFTKSSIEEHRWRGYREGDLRRLLGAPTHVYALYENVGRKGDSNNKIPPGPYRTLVYECTDGYLYVWLADPGSGFECFDSLWFDRDVKF